jgi:hypothetical protein
MVKRGGGAELVVPQRGDPGRVPVPIEAGLVRAVGGQPALDERGSQL